MSDDPSESSPESSTGSDPGPPPGNRSIRALDDRTVQRIAAGEVVERPASVVKELVENALDAGASRISVAVEAGGTEGIRVRDDGHGIPADQLTDAVAEHATSKIGDIEDLESGVGTLGFRGEALHTIGAVSRLTVRSRPRGGGGVLHTVGVVSKLTVRSLPRGGAGAGAELVVEGGDVGEITPAGCPDGTTVEVEDLFYNTPARRKFLKTEATEFDHVNTVVTQYALANPDVAMSLEHDGRELFATQGDGQLRSTVLSVYGREVAESMIDVEWTPTDGSVSSIAPDSADADPDEETAAVESIHGLVSHPEINRSTREYLSTFVNDRYVTAQPLREGVLAAYGGQLAGDRYPFAVLFVSVPPSSVDVNVHPRKMEVRFDEESAVRAAVEDAVEAALLDHGLIRSTAPRGRSRADETPVSPEAPDEEAVGGAGTPHETAADVDSGAPRRERRQSELRDVTDEEGHDPGRSGADIGTTGSDSVHRSTAESDSTDRRTDDFDSTGSESADNPDPATSPEQSSSDSRPSPRSWQETETSSPDGDGPATTDSSRDQLGSGSNSESTSPDTPSPSGSSGTNSDIDTDSSSADGSGSAGTASEPESAGTTSETGSGDEPTNSATPSGDRSPFTLPTSQRTLDGDDATLDLAFDSLPHLRVLGQLHDTYVVAETDDGLVLIDQHAADERINYERLQAELTGSTPTQALADPVELELTAREAELFDRHGEALAQLGFHAGRTGERTVEVRTVPAVFDAALEPSLLRDVLTEFVRADVQEGTDTIDAVADSLLADLACYPSITGNTSLREGTVTALLEALDDCRNPYACPHGRPVIVAIDEAEIGERFERDYPGHGGSRRD